MAYSDLISSDEWHSYTPKEQANYYNRINMTLAHFTYKMRTSKKDIIEDFSRSNYHYNEHTNKFKTVTQSHIERWRLLLYQRRMSTKYIDCDD